MQSIIAAISATYRILLGTLILFCFVSKFYGLLNALVNAASLVSENQHSVTETVKAVTPGYRLLVTIQYEFTPGKG